MEPNETYNNEDQNLDRPITHLEESIQGEQEGIEDKKGEEKGDTIRSARLVENEATCKENKAKEKRSKNVRGQKRKSNKKRKRPKSQMNPWLVALSIICGCVAFVMVWSNIISSVFYNSGMDDLGASLGKTIDVIHVEGTIGSDEVNYNHAWTLDEIDYLMQSDKNKAILLYVNSPGGAVYEADELYLKLMEYKETTGRPIYAYMAQTAASGGLYICMAADKIYANRMTMTGSIGVIMSMMDTTGLQDLIGVKTDNVVSGVNKSMGNPLTDEQRSILQSMVDETYEIFVDIVSKSRGLSLEKTKEIADGRVYSAMQAKELGLIDEVGLIEDVINDLRLTYDLQDCELYHCTAPVDKWQALFGGLAQSTSGILGGEFSAIQDYIKSNRTAKLMYYYGN